jgi:hypothetical protein
MRATPPTGWTTPQAKVLPRQEKARSVRLHRRVRALEKAASLKTLASYFCSLFLFGCLRLLSGARYGNTPCLLLSVRRGARSLPTLA